MRVLTWQGRLRCLGSSSHLKARFGGGSLLEVHAAAEEPVQARLAAFIARELGGQPLGEGQFGRAKFRLPAEAQVWTALWKALGPHWPPDAFPQRMACKAFCSVIHVEQDMASLSTFPRPAACFKEMSVLF